MKLNEWYYVTDGSGLYSWRVGRYVDYHPYKKEIENESGRYKTFDPKREVTLLGTDGKLFTMFKSRLCPMNPFGQSLMEKANNFHHWVGVYLYDIKQLADNNEILWDFYDLFPRYILDTIQGRCSLSRTMTFDMEREIMGELEKVLHEIGHIIKRLKNENV